MLQNKGGRILRRDESWRESRYTRNVKKGMRVHALVNMNGRTYRKLYVPPFQWTRHVTWHPGTLIKAEWKYGHCMTQVRYTVQCDDGKIRRVQVIRRMS